MGKGLSRLKKGDTIAIVAPSGYCSPKVLEASKKYLEKRGYQVYAEKRLLKKNLHFANSDQERFQALKKALQNKKVKAIWSLRGGSGGQRLLPYLYRLKKPSTKKLFIGFSDNSTLHYFLNSRWQWPSLHAPTLSRMVLKKQPKREEKAIWQELEGENEPLSLTGLKGMNSQARKTKNIQGKMLGGNLTSLQALLGSPLKLEMKNKILFLEDVGERPYRIDRCLVSMGQAGVFKGVKALVFGDFSDCNALKGQPSIQKTLEAFANEVSFPVFKGLKAGHGALQLPLWLNTKTKISSNKIIMENPLK